ncbi:MAG: PBP1A family penicillin-binding protein [Candidatus Kapabacteria bacterium]|jgi:penicillin-binding protein 1A|nr:PBP1A family penicillin-binding protein [Candidatus Kapabacteria bacterium]
MTVKRFLIVLLFVNLLGGFILYEYIDTVVSEGIPSVYNLENPQQNFATRVISGDGELLDLFCIEKRISKPDDEIPQDFINALIATEDRKFYRHWGLDIDRIIKAIVKGLMRGSVREGASTITQQLARNLFLDQSRTLSRKLREAKTAMLIEEKYTKDEIIRMYANTVHFGRGAYGIQSAAQIYFDKIPEELSTAECAFLVGVLKAPTHYNGMVNKEKAVRRRNLVLRLMKDQGFLAHTEFIEAYESLLEFSHGKIKKNNQSYLAPHFVETIRKNLKKNKNIDSYNFYRDGLTIYTTLNTGIQKYANEVVQDHMDKYQKKFNKSWRWRNNKKLLNEFLKEAAEDRADYSAASASEKKKILKNLKRNSSFVDSVKNAVTTVQIGLVVINPVNGKVLAMVGASPKFMEDQSDAKYSLNHANQIKRQPGSAFKPFVYASALEAGMTPESIVECGPYSFELPSGDIWIPRGTGNCEEGDTKTLYQALVSSINTVAARLITEVTTPRHVVEMAHRAGIRSRLLAVPALALGAGGEVVPIEMVSAYGTFPNRGIHVKPYYVARVEDRFGNTLFEKTKSIQANDVMSRKIADKMIFMMQGVVEYGTGRSARKYFKGVECGGKTGTTNDYTDAWFVGYTPQLVAGVWVGFDDQRITFTGGYGYASAAAAPVWGKLMDKIYKDKKLPYKQKQFHFNNSDSDSSEFSNMYTRIQEIKNRTSSTITIDSNAQNNGSSTPNIKSLDSQKRGPQ